MPAPVLIPTPTPAQQMLWLFLIFYGAPNVLSYYEKPSECDYYTTSQAQLCCPMINGALDPSCLQPNGFYAKSGCRRGACGGDLTCTSGLRLLWAVYTPRPPAWWRQAVRLDLD